MDKKAVKTPMEKLTEDYEEFIEGKELNKKEKESFNKTLKKATKSTKQTKGRAKE